MAAVFQQAPRLGSAEEQPGSVLELGGPLGITDPEAAVTEAKPAAPASACALHDRQLLEDQAGAAGRLAAWLAVLGAGYGFQRGLCAGGLPYDCDPLTAEEHFSSLTTLAFVGSALGWLVGVARPDRFSWLARSRRRTACLLITYLATFPIYGGISNVPAMQTSLASTGSWGPVMIALFVLAAAAALAALAFHLWLAVQAGGSGGGSGSAAGGAAVGWTEQAHVQPQQQQRQAALVAGPPSSKSISSSVSSSSGTPCQAWDSSEEGRRSTSGGGGSGRRQQQQQQVLPILAVAAAGDVPVAPKWGSRARRWRLLGLYLLPRLAVLLYFAVWLAAMPASGAYTLHLHHFALGWGVAIWAVFNHPLSGAVLAIATAVFVQGAGAYGFDPFFKPAAKSGGCLPLTSQTGQMNCVFWSNDPFALDICSDTQWIPWFDCSLPWPWPGTAVNRNGSAAAAVGTPGLPGAASLSPAQGPRGGPWP